MYYISTYKNNRTAHHLQLWQSIKKLKLQNYIILLYLCTISPLIFIKRFLFYINRDKKHQLFIFFVKNRPPHTNIKNVNTSNNFQFCAEILRYSVNRASTIKTSTVQVQKKEKGASSRDTPSCSYTSNNRYLLFQFHSKHHTIITI